MANRKWLQFSLRSSLLFVTCLSIGIGLWSERVRRYQRAITVLTDSGAKICTLADTKNSQKTLQLTYGLRRASPLPKTLEPQDGDEEIVTEVVLWEADSVDDSKLKQVGVLRTLECLYCDSKQVTQQGWQYLKKLPKLKRLNLSNSSITDEGLAVVVGMHKLEMLCLSNTEVSDSTLANLALLKNLEWLELDDTRITDAGLAHLAGLSSLKTLNIQGTKVTDAGLVHLFNLKKLESLYVGKTQQNQQASCITTAGRDSFNKRLPKCRVNGSFSHPTEKAE